MRPKYQQAKATQQREPIQMPLLLEQTCSNGIVSGAFKLISFKAGRKPANPKRPKLKAVREFLENYIATKDAGGEQPTQREAEELGMQSGIRRSQVREVYPELQGAVVRQGRPRILWK